MFVCCDCIWFADNEFGNWFWCVKIWFSSIELERDNKGDWLKCSASDLFIWLNGNVGVCVCKIEDREIFGGICELVIEEFNAIGWTWFCMFCWGRDDCCRVIYVKSTRLTSDVGSLAPELPIFVPCNFSSFESWSR